MCVVTMRSYRTEICLLFRARQIAFSVFLLATMELGLEPVNPNTRQTNKDVTWIGLLQKMGANVDDVYSA